MNQISFIQFSAIILSFSYKSLSIVYFFYVYSLELEGSFGDPKWKQAIIEKLKALSKMRLGNMSLYHLTRNWLDMNRFSP